MISYRISTELFFFGAAGVVVGLGFMVSCGFTLKSSAKQLHIVWLQVKTKIRVTFWVPFGCLFEGNSLMVLTHPWVCWGFFVGALSDARKTPTSIGLRWKGRPVDGKNCRLLHAFHLTECSERSFFSTDLWCTLRPLAPLVLKGVYHSNPLSHPRSSTFQASKLRGKLATSVYSATGSV